MYQEKVEAYIDSHIEEMIEDVKTLVRIDSKKGMAMPGKPFGIGPAQAIEAAQKMMENYGFSTRNYENYVVTGDFNNKEKQLDILAHLDIVTVTPDWTVTQPFDPIIVDGKLYGRGTADDKGPAIAALYAMRAIKECGIDLKKNVRLILGADEECGSSDLEYYYSIEKEAPMSFTPDAEFPLINIEKGRLAKEFSIKFEKEELSSEVVDYYSIEKEAPMSFTPDAEFPLINIEKGRLAKEFSIKFEKEELSSEVVAVHGGDKANVVPANAYALIRGLSKETVEAAASKETDGVAYTVTEEDGLIKVAAKGAAAHASTPEMGKNAVCALLGLLSRLPLAAGKKQAAIAACAKLFPTADYHGAALGIDMADEISGTLSMNLGIINLENEVLIGEFDSRIPLCGTDENVTEVIRKNMAEHGLILEDGKMIGAHHVPADSPLVKSLLDSFEKYSGIKGEPMAIGGGTYVLILEDGKMIGAHHVPADSPLVKSLLDSFEKYSGIKGEPMAIGGGTYVHELERGVAFGCMMEGVDNHMHGDDEFMEIDVLVMSAKIFADAILKLCM